MGTHAEIIQTDLFDVPKIISIPVTYVDDLDWVYVRIRKPEKIHGAKALKNEDFKDHDFWPEMYAKTRQREAFYSKYKKRQNTNMYTPKMVTAIDVEIEFTQIVKPIEYMPDAPLHHIPTFLSKYESRVDVSATMPTGNVMELTFMGPLINPILLNRTTGREVRLDYQLPAGEEATFYVLWDNATGDLIYRFINFTVLWELAADRNTIEFLAESGIEDGGEARIVIPA